MDKIPSDMLGKILELRTANGLESSEAAVYADLEKSKCKWTIQDTPRYRRAGASPLWVSGKYLSSYGTCPATGEKDQGRAGAVRTPRAASASPRATSAAPMTVAKIDESAFYKVLHGKGFQVKVSQNLLTGEIETQLPDAISKLDLQFSAIPANASGVHVSQTSPQIQISMPLEKFLEVAGIRP